MPRNGLEGSIIEGIEVYGVSTLKEAADYLNGNIKLIPEKKQLLAKEEIREGDFSKHGTGNAKKINLK